MSKWVTNIEQAMSVLQGEIDLLQDKADGIISAPKKLMEYPKEDDKKFRWSRYVTHAFSGTFDLRMELYYKGNGNWDKYQSPFTQDSIDLVLSHFDDTTKSWIEEAGYAYAVNENSIAHNKLQRERLTLVMKTLGVPDSHSTWEYKRSNSKNKSEVKHRAGYLGDLDRAVPINSYYKEKLLRFETKRNQIEQFGKKLLISEKAKAVEIENAERAKKSVHELAFLRVKYTPNDLSSDIDDIMESILDKNKYLMLAYALEQTRNDWNEGYGSAERGLDSFVAETHQDQMIETDIQTCIDTQVDGVDGRIFRDCTYNYTVLYGMVDDSELISDFMVAGKLMEDF